MNKVGFDAEKYIEEQSKYILERINAGNSERLYLEFGGKLVHDKHAMRVLPGFDENAKIKLLEKMQDQAEIIICIYSGDIINSKTRQDFGITYDLEVLRLIDIFRKHNLKINSVVVTRYEDAPAVNMFINKLERRDIKTYKHFFTKGYPTDVETIVSEEGYGANPYIEVTKPLVVVTGPGGGSGKLATCLSQLYHDGYMEARSVEQTSVFEAAELFARVEGTLPAPESSHAIRAAIDEALKCKETGEEKTILFGLTGTGYFDLKAYEQYNDGKMTDIIPTDEQIEASLRQLPVVEK